jgi:Tol biopolymer transport system component
MVGKVLGETGEELYLMDPADYRMERVGDTFGTSGWGIPSPDGRYLIGMLPAQKSFALVSLPDGASRVLCPYSPEGWPAFAWSPDGTKLVWGEQRLLKMYSVVDGTIRTLVEAGQDQKMSEGLVGTPHTAWSPDGTKIAYLLGNAAPDAKARAELWVVEATGGSPRKIADAPPSHPLMSDVTWHPSGNTILVQARAPKGNEGEYEHWVMENFLPKPASAAGAKAK